MEEKHDTSRNIIIAIIVIAIIAVLGYFIYTSTLDNEDEAIPNDTTDNVIEDEDNTFDEVGSYRGMETFGDEEATGTIELVLNEDGTATLALVYNDTNEYTGTYTKNGNNITFNADSNEGATTDEGLLEDALDGDDNTDANDNNDNNTDNNTNTTDGNNDTTTNQTFNFRIDGDTLVYISEETGSDVTLNKVDKNNLEYIQ